MAAPSETNIVRQGFFVQLLNGAYIDPRSITYIHAVAGNGRPGMTDAKAIVIIETRAGGNHRLPVSTFPRAIKYRDTLAHICIEMHRAPGRKARGPALTRGEVIPEDDGTHAIVIHGRGGRM